MVFVDAYRKDTGEKLPHRVPEHFLGHPVLGKNLSKTPRQKAADRQKNPTEAPASGDEKEH